MEQAESEQTLLPPLGRFADHASRFAELHANKRAQGLPVLSEVWIAVLRGGRSRTAQGVAAWERWAIGNYCNGITHIELVLRDNLGNTVAWTVDRYNPARDPDSGFVRQRVPDPRTMYPAPYWECKQVSTLLPEERYGLLEFLHRQCGKPMDEWGMKMNFLPLIGPWLVGAPRDEEDAYYCSQLVASAFRWIRPAEFGHINPRRCTPAELDVLLSAHRDIFVAGTLRPVDIFDM